MGKMKEKWEKHLVLKGTQNIQRVQQTEVRNK